MVSVMKTNKLHFKRDGEWRVGVLFFFFTEVKYTKHFSVNSMAFCIFTFLCNYHLYLIPKHFHHLQSRCHLYVERWHLSKDMKKWGSDPWKCLGQDLSRWRDSKWEDLEAKGCFGGLEALMRPEGCSVWVGELWEVRWEGLWGSFEKVGVTQWYIAHASGTH